MSWKDRIEEFPNGCAQKVHPTVPCFKFNCCPVFSIFCSCEHISYILLHIKCILLRTNIVANTFPVTEKQLIHCFLKNLTISPDVIYKHSMKIRSGSEMIFILFHVLLQISQSDLLPNSFD
jgi:hypothetical protein